MPNGFFYPNSFDRSISSKGCLVSFIFLLLPCFTEIPVLNANNVDPDQTPRSAASEPCLHFLLMSLLWDTRHERVNSWIPNGLFYLSLWSLELGLRFLSSESKEGRSSLQRWPYYTTKINLINKQILFWPWEVSFVATIFTNDIKWSHQIKRF